MVTFIKISRTFVRYSGDSAIAVAAKAVVTCIVLTGAKTWMTKFGIDHILESCVFTLFFSLRYPVRVHQFTCGKNAER